MRVWAKDVRVSFRKAVLDTQRLVDGLAGQGEVVRAPRTSEHLRRVPGATVIERTVKPTDSIPELRPHIPRWVWFWWESLAGLGRSRARSGGEARLPGHRAETWTSP